MNFKILITDGLSSEGVALLERQAEVVNSPDLSRLGDFDAVIVRSRTKLSADVIDTGVPRLRVIGRAGVGTDNIDLKSAKQHGIVVVNTPNAPTIATAELTLGLMLALARQIPRADSSIRMGEWRKSELMGLELFRKTLGIVGVGRIGTAVATRARAFGMEVLGFDPLIDENTMRERGAEPATFNDLLQFSDFISLHVPLTDETHGLIDDEALKQMKKDARLISTSRGGVVDEKSLVDNLDRGHLGGVALDVFANEPSDNTALLQHPMIIHTPHIGAQTLEARIRTSTGIAMEVMAALNQEPIRWRVF